MYIVLSGMMENARNVLKGHILVQLGSVFLSMIIVGLGIILMGFVFPAIKGMNSMRETVFNHLNMLKDLLI